MDQNPPAGSDPLRPDLEPPAEPANEPVSRSKRTVAIVIGVAVGLLGAAAAAAMIAMSGSDAKLLDRIPASADVAGTVYLDPAAGQKANLFRMLTAFPDFSDQAALADEWNAMLDEALRDTGLTHDDLDWVGSQVAGYVDFDEGLEHPTGAFLLAVDDVDGAQAALDAFVNAAEQRGEPVVREEHDGVEVVVAGDEGDGAAAIVDGVMVFASGADVIDDVIATGEGDSLGASGIYTETMAELPDEHLASVFLNYPELAGSLEEVLALTGVAPGQLSSEGVEGMALTVSAEPEGFAVDLFAGIDEAALSDAQREALEDTHAITLTELVPADAFGFLTQTGFDVGLADGLERLGDQEPQVAAELAEAGVTGPGGLVDVVGSDIALEVSPGNDMPLDGAVLVTTKDPEAMLALLDRWATDLSTSFVSEGSIPWIELEHGGITYRSMDPIAIGAPVSYGIVDDVAVIAVSPSEMNEIIDLAQGGGASIDTDPNYRDAVMRVPSADGVFYIDVGKVISALGRAFPQDVIDLNDLRPIVTVTAGTEADLGGSRARVFIEIP